jgi:uncharacterized membrane protein (UPF0127 family)
MLDKQHLPLQQLKVKDITLNVEVADTLATRQAGLSNRSTLDKDHGMWFVYPDSQIRHFTMRNTTMPLSIAFLNSEGVIIDIQKMQPKTRKLYSSNTEAMFAIEVKLGWFEKHTITQGDRFVFSPQAD